MQITGALQGLCISIVMAPATAQAADNAVQREKSGAKIEQAGTGLKKK